MDPAEALPLFWDIPPSARIRPSRWRSFCKRLGLVALAAEEDGEGVRGLVGLAPRRALRRLVRWGTGLPPRRVLVRAPRLPPG